MKHLTTGQFEEKIGPQQHKGHARNAISFVLIIGVFLFFSLTVIGGVRLPEDARKALRHATKSTLYSLEPWAQQLPAGDSLPELDGYAVLGQTNLDAAQTDEAARAIRSALSQWSMGQAACFDPRHALRVTAEGQTFDFLLCYACDRMEILQNGEHLSTHTLSGSPDKLNALLKKAGVPLSKYYDAKTK